MPAIINAMIGGELSIFLNKDALDCGAELTEVTAHELPKIENSVALQLKDKLTNIQHKLAEDTFGWTVKV